MKILFNDTRQLVQRKACNYYGEIVYGLMQQHQVKYVCGRVSKLSDLLQYYPDCDVIILGFAYTDVGDNNVPSKVINDVEKPVVTQILTSQPTITVAVSGKMDDLALSDFTADIKDEIDNLSGITYTSIVAKREKEITVEVSKSTLQKYNLTLNPSQKNFF